MKTLERITIDPDVMGGRPCVRGLRITVNILVGLVAAKHSREQILQWYPLLEHEDLTQALLFASVHSVNGRPVLD